MFDLVKTVLGGASALIIGWVLPTYISLQMAVFLVLPGLRRVPLLSGYLRDSHTTDQLALASIALAAGLAVAAVQAPLYRIVEGYLLWPSKLRDMRIRSHQEQRRTLVTKSDQLAGTPQGVKAGLAYERAARYPAQDRQFAPTTLGNAIRRFETYAGDRYRLDSQLLWHHLTAAAPDTVVTAVSRARTNVDFFVCLLYGGAVNALLGLFVILSGHADPRREPQWLRG